MNRIILASSSPRRKELLEREGIDFLIDASYIDEVLDETLSLEDQLIQVAYNKGLPIHQKYYDDIVLSADTTVYCNHEIIGKPKDQEDARRILQLLSDNTQYVYTSVALFYKENVVTFTEKTKVIFKDITSLIDDYLESDEWKDKAGGYAIQGYGKNFIAHTEGDLDNVIGLPVKRVIKEIENMKKKQF